MAFCSSPQLLPFLFSSVLLFPIKDESSSLSICSKCSWRTTRSHPPCSRPSQVLHYNMEKEQSQGLHDVLTADSPVVLKISTFGTLDSTEKLTTCLSLLPAMQKTQVQYTWVGKIPGRREWQPTPVFLPGEFHGQRSLVDFGPWGHKESDTTE